jgi:hypothetical protein
MRMVSEREVKLVHREALTREQLVDELRALVLVRGAEKRHRLLMRRDAAHEIKMDAADEDFITPSALPCSESPPEQRSIFCVCRRAQRRRSRFMAEESGA